jgi:hypothetical protein
MQSRITNVGEEKLRDVMSPIKLIFHRLPPPGYSLSESLETLLTDARAGRIEIFPDDLLIFIESAMDAAKRIKAKGSELSEDEIAAISLYTMEHPTEKMQSIYWKLNEALRNEDRKQLTPFIKYLWLFMHAFKKCPAFTGAILYRGVKGAHVNIADYTPGKEIVWCAVSSLSDDISTQNVFLGKSGDYRFLFEVELTQGSARVIKMYSAFPAENEVVLPPNTRLQVVNVYSPAPGFNIIQLKEMKSKDAILDLSIASPPPSIFTISGGGSGGSGGGGAAAGGLMPVSPQTAQPVSAAQPSTDTRAFSSLSPEDICILLGALDLSDCVTFFEKGTNLNGDRLQHATEASDIVTLAPGLPGAIAKQVLIVFTHSLSLTS